MRLLSSEEAQERLGISRPTLYLWVKQGKLNPQRAGRGLRFEEDEVQRLLGRGTQVAAWIRRGRLPDLRREVGRAVRANGRPTILLEYLAEPAAGFVRARVVADRLGGAIPTPGPGRTAFDALIGSKRRFA